MRRRTFVVYINLGDRLPGPELAVNIVVDDSGSMAGDPISKVRDALRSLVEQAPPGTRLGLIGFGSTVQVIAEPTEHREFVLDQVERFQGRSGATMLFDAIGEACDRFDADGRHRYVLVLTDGADTGSARFSMEKVSDKKNLPEHAVAAGVRVFALGFGSVDRTNLERLARATGGKYIETPDLDGLITKLAAALQMITRDREEIPLRCEFARLVEGASTDLRWLRHLSLDEWDEETIWKDTSHIRFRRPSERSVEAYRREFEGWSAHLQDTLEAQVRDQAKSGSFPPDVDLIVAGWLHDPGFRALSLEVSRTFALVQQRLSAALPGVAYPVFLALSHETGTLEPVERAEFYAWLTAARNSGGALSPKAIVVCEDGNVHRQLNPAGYSGASRNKVLCQAASILRSLAIDPDLLSRLVGYQEEGMTRLRAVGSASLECGSRWATEARAFHALRAVVERISSGRPHVEEMHRRGERRFRESRLGLCDLKESLLGPLEPASPEKVLATVRLDESSFWPKPSEIAEQDYLSVLPNLIDERASEFVYRKQEALRRTLQQRGTTIFESAVAGLKADVDAILFGCDEASTSDAQAYLAHFRALLDQEIGRLNHEALSAPELERTLLFADEERLVHAEGRASRAQARERLEALIRTRPLAEALAVRHGVLAALGACAAACAARLVPSVVLDVGFRESPVMAALTVAAVVLAVGVIRWRLARQRLGTAVKEYLGAIVREARSAALQESVAQLRAIYTRLAEWAGDTDEIAVVDPAVGRDETTLSERQRVTALREYLVETVDRLIGRLRQNLQPDNPFVWELQQKLGHQPRGTGRDRPVEDISGLALSWADVAPLAENVHWRQVCRRRRFDDLRTYLEFHRERLEFADRLRGRATAAAREAEHESRLSAHVPVEPSDRFGQLLAELDAVTFPGLQLEDVAQLEDPQWIWQIDPDEFERIHNKLPEDRLVDKHWRRPTVRLEVPCAAHRVCVARVPLSEARQWRGHFANWQALPDEKRERILTSYGWTERWIDPMTEKAPTPFRTPAPHAEGAEGDVL